MARPKIRGVANDLSQVTATDWARLAAYIDGEGHVAIQENVSKTGRRYQYIRVIVTNTCRHAEQVLIACFTYFITKRDQAEIALAFQSTLHDFRRGRSIPPDVQMLRDQYRARLNDARWVQHAEIKRDEHGNVTSFLH